MLKIIKEDVDSFTAELINIISNILDDNKIKHKEQSVISDLFTIINNKPMYEIILQCLLLNKYKNIKNSIDEVTSEHLKKNGRKLVKVVIENKKVLEQNILYIKVRYNFLPIE